MQHLKKEYISKKSYAIIEEIVRDVFEYIDIFYDGKRMHSILGYMSPVETKRNILLGGLFYEKVNTIICITIIDNYWL